jgi:hypothetical protein
MCIYWAEAYTLQIKNIEISVVASNDTGLEINAEKAKNMVVSRYQNAGRSHSIKTDNKSFGKVKKFKYLETIPTNKNSIQEASKGRLKSGNACYHSVQNILYSSLLSKNIKIKIYRTIILSVFQGWETWFLTLREEHRLRVFEDRVLRRIFVFKRDGVTREWRSLGNEELNDLYFSLTIIPLRKARSTIRAGHVAGVEERRGAYRISVGRPE